MKELDYSASITVDLSLQKAYKAINNVTEWWTDDLKGNFQELNDEFSVQFADIHYSKQKVTELIPNTKVVWLVTESNLTFVEKKDEWTGTRIIFELIKLADNKTKIDFTHKGLVPAFQCYGGCSQGWDHYFKGSLFKLLTEGKGTPGL